MQLAETYVKFSWWSVSVYYASIDIRKLIVLSTHGNLIELPRGATHMP